MSVTHKYIVIQDIGKTLNPIGIGLKSPIMTPSKFPIEVIGRLLTVSNVTRMFEAHPDDRSMRVPLDRSNYRKSFEEIWRELNPDKEYPFERTISEVPSASVKEEVPPVEDDVPSTEEDLPEVEEPESDKATAEVEQSESDDEVEEDDEPVESGDDESNPKPLVSAASMIKKKKGKRK